MLWCAMSYTLLHNIRRIFALDQKWFFYKITSLMFASSLRNLLVFGNLRPPLCRLCPLRWTQGLTSCAAVSECTVTFQASLCGVLLMRAARTILCPTPARLRNKYIFGPFTTVVVFVMASSPILQVKKSQKNTYTHFAMAINRGL